MRPRGVLCSNCNHGLGLFQDSVWVLERAAAYLRVPTIVQHDAEVEDDLCGGTIDELVLLRHETKRSVQDLLIEATKRGVEA